MTDGFRFEPPSVGFERLVPRTRLMPLLRRRFERRLTVLNAVAGYGKTTTLALAVQANRMQPVGVDVWLGADEYDYDPDRLSGGLAVALGIVPQAADDIEAIVTEVWSRAPDDVAIIIDDVHEINSPESMAVLTALLRRLPANGHLVLAGRGDPSLPLARLRAHDQLLELGADDLAFDDTELASLASVWPDRGVDTSTLPRLPALAELRLRAGARAGADFLWEEILSSLPATRVRALLRSSVLEELDDTLVRTLSEGEFDAERLLEGLPLVDRTRSGRYRLHALMRAALSGRLEPAEHAEAAHVAADMEANRGNFRAAVQLLAAAGEPDATIAMARRYMLMPTLRRTFEDQNIVRGIVEPIQPSSVLVRLLRVEGQLGEFSTTTDPKEVYERLAALAADACLQGDEEIEATAIFRAIQLGFLETSSPNLQLRDRLAELASRIPFAAQVLRHVDAEAMLHTHGDVEACLRCLTPIETVSPDLELVMRSGLLCILGRPELVAPDLSPDELANLPEGAEVFISYAMWLRGELSPELALPLANMMMAATVARRVVAASVGILGVTSIIGITAGDRESAAICIREAERVARYGCSPHIALHILLAQAALTCVERGDDAAAVELDAALVLVPLVTWPARPYFLALPLVYVTRPETRPMLDACDLGTVLGVALEAARALVELRETGSAAAACALPWHEQNVLRVHVLPPHLAELAAAASQGNEPKARLLLTQLPDARRHLRAVRTKGGPVAPFAEFALAGLPATPDTQIEILVLGPMRLVRDGELVTEPNWERRGRVRELLALLVEERRVPRSRAASLLWPDLDDDKATSNLRVTLTYLQRVLEPDRDPYSAPFFVQLIGGCLVLAEEVVVDADKFEAEVTRALEQDRVGSPHAALQTYQQAIERYLGNYLEDLDVEWASATRARFAFLVVNSMCRVGELTLARGEPETAGKWALRARRLTPLNERAERLLVSCMLGSGDRAGAAKVVRELFDGLHESGLAPEAESVALRRRVLDLGPDS